MARRPLAALLALHALAHSLAGMRATDGLAVWSTGAPVWSAELSRWAFTLLWVGAVVGLLLAAAALAGVRPLGGRWRRWALLGVACSVPLLAFGWMRWLAVPGLVLDAALMAAVLFLATGGDTPLFVGRREPVRPRDLAALGAVAMLALVLALRPWHVRWGASEGELRAALPGDEAARHATYQIQHAVTVHAPPEAVWPWLVQLGEDRGGFYSYAWLENLFGLRIRNADRVHPEWQRLVPGDSVYATHRGWLGIERRFGWRVGRVEPERLLVLEGWGAFVLQPVGDSATRLIVRTRGEGRDDLRSLVLAPLGLLVFEPAHFVMEQRMLRTLRDRAEARL